MQTDEAWLESIALHLAAMGAASSAAEVLDRLLAASMATAPRAALFLVRRGRLRGYRALGEGEDALRRILTVDLPADEGWAARNRKGQSPVVLNRDDPDGPAFGQSAAAETCVVWLSLEGKPMAALRVARQERELPWSPQGLAILATCAQSRLDVELLRKRREAPAAVPAEPSAAAVAAPVPAAPSLAPPAEAAFTVTVSAAEPQHSGDETGLVPFDPIEPPKDPQALRVEEARRFARLVATDIRLYNEEAVLVGRRQRDLSQRLGDQMERGRESFHRRFSDLGVTGVQLIDDAYIEVLAAGDGTLLALTRTGTSAIKGAG